MRRRSIAGKLLAFGQRAISWLKTRDARTQAVVGADTRISHTGEIVNIRGDRQRIRIGANCFVGGQVLIFAHAGRIEIGDLVFIGAGSRIWSSFDLKIGDRVLISHDVQIHDTESHPLDTQARAAQTLAIMTKGHPREIEGIKAAPVVIGDDVWIGFGATIRKGVTIGSRSIIGARAVIDRDVPPDAIVRTPGTMPAQKDAS